MTTGGTGKVNTSHFRHFYTAVPRGRIQALFAQIINTLHFGAYLKGMILEKVYRKQRAREDGGIHPQGPSHRGGEIMA